MQKKKTKKVKYLTTLAFAIVLGSIFTVVGCRQIISIHPDDRSRIDRFTTTVSTTKSALKGIEKELNGINRNARDLDNKLESLKKALNSCQTELESLRNTFGPKKK